jgi:hypothetical protein
MAQNPEDPAVRRHPIPSISMGGLSLSVRQLKDSDNLEAYSQREVLVLGG